MIDYRWLTWQEMTADQFHDIIWLRLEVFVVEQECLVNELDGLDRHAWHLFARDEKGELVAYLRLVKPGKKYDEPALGRVITAQSVRGSGIGREIMLRAIEKSEELYPGKGIRLSGQVYAKGFYEKLGFVQVSEPYDEDGIPHIEMLRRD